MAYTDYPTFFKPDEHVQIARNQQAAGLSALGIGLGQLGSGGYNAGSIEQYATGVQISKDSVALIPRDQLLLLCP